MNTQSLKKVLLENPISISIIIGIIYFGTFGFLEVYNFSEWKYGPFIQSVLGVFLGAGAIGIITGVIIMFQAALESKKEKAKEIFDQKIGLYKTVIDDISTMFEDGIINELEFRKIELLMLKLQLMAKDETVSAFVVFYKKITENILDDGEDKEMEVEVDMDLKNLLSDFVNQCRTDLELSDQKLNPEIFSEIITIQKQANQSIEFVRFKPSNGLTVSALVNEAIKSLQKQGREVVNKRMVHEEIAVLHPGPHQPAAASVACKLMAYTSENYPHPTKGHYQRDVPHRDNNEYDWLDFKDKKFFIKNDLSTIN